jgi:2-polyprenyl-6-methoxyphenol hydroxylase-like FAD-dependent oxidoreductase
MQLTCDGLFKLFHTQDPLLGWLRNTGLSLTQHLPLIKRQLAKQAIGF